MNKFVRFILFLLSLGLIVGLVMALSVFVTIPWLSDTTNNLIQNTSWVSTVLAVVVMFFLVSTVVALLLDFFVPNRSKVFEMKRDIGNIEISNKSIESVATQAMAEVPGIRRYSAKVRGNASPGKIKLDLFAETDHLNTLAASGGDIQQHVAERLASTLDIAPSHIHVKVDPYLDENRAASRKGAEMPRVI